MLHPTNLKECRERKNSWRHKKNYTIDHFDEKEMTINNFTYQNDPEENYKRTKTILNMVASTVLKQEKHKRLLNKLAKADLVDIDYEEVKELLPLILSNTIETSADEDEETNQTKKEI